MVNYYENTEVQSSFIEMCLQALFLVILFGLGTYDYYMEPVGNDGRVSGIIQASFAFLVSLYYLINGRLFFFVARNRTTVFYEEC